MPTITYTCEKCGTQKQAFADVFEFNENNYLTATCGCGNKNKKIKSDNVVSVDYNNISLNIVSESGGCGSHSCGCKN